MKLRFLPIILLLCSGIACAQSSFIVPVQNTTGQAITGATVTFVCTDTLAGCLGKGPFTATSVNGNAQFTGIPAGNYTVTVTGQGIITYSYTRNITGGGSGNVIVTAASIIVLPLTTSPSSFTITDFFITLTTNVNSVSVSGTPNPGDEIVVTLLEGAPGGFTFTWPANFLNTPTLQSGNGQVTAMTFQFCGTAGNGGACPANSWQATDVGPAGTGTIQNLTPNFIPKASGPQAITANSACDDGVTTPSTVTCSEVLAAPGINSSGPIQSTGPCNGGTAGCDQLGQGTAPTTLPANTITIQAPPAVTSYRDVLPGVSASGCLVGTASTDGNGLPTNTKSFVPCTANSASVVYLSAGANQIPATPAANTTYVLTDTSANYTQSAAITVSNAGVQIMCTNPRVVIQFTGTTDGFDVTGANFHLTGCTLDHNSQSAAGTGPLVTIGTSGTVTNDAVISYNIIQNAGTTNTQTGTILVQNGRRTQIIYNEWTGTLADRAVYDFPIAAKSTEDTNISWNVVTTCSFNLATGCFTALDSNGSAATISGLRFEHNTIYGQNASGYLLQIQGTSIAQTAASPRNVTVSYNNFFLTGTITSLIKMFTFLNSRMEGNVFDDKTFTNQNLVLLGDSYNSSFIGNTLRSAGGTANPAWLSTDEEGNSTVGNQIFLGSTAQTAGFEWAAVSGPMTANSVTSNSVQLFAGSATFCYWLVNASNTFNADGNVISSNNCIGTGTAGQEGLDVRITTATGATNILATVINNNIFTNVPTGVRIFAAAQTNTGPATIRGVLLDSNSFETVTNAVLINPTASSGAGATNISSVSIDGNYYKSVTTGYSATPGAQNSISGTILGQAFYDNVTTPVSDTGSGTIKSAVEQVLNVANDFITAANTNLQLITGLQFTFPANLATNAKVDCDFQYNQQTAAVVDGFGYQDVTVASTQTNATLFVQTAATTWQDSVLTASAPVAGTPTNVATFTPSAITTVWHAQLHFFVEHPSNASSSAFQIMTRTATAGDTVTVKRGSYCTVAFQ